MANISTLGYIRSEKLVKWVTIFMVIQVIVAVIGMISGFLEYSLLIDYEVMSDDAAKVASDNNQIRQTLIFSLQAFTYFVTAILVLKWIYRANYNAHQLGADNMGYGPGMSVAWFFVPVMGLWKPYQAMDQIWKASYQPVNWRSAKGHPAVGIWWAFWLSTVFVGFVSLKVAHDAYDISSSMNSSLVEMASDFTTLLSTLAMLMLVKSINQAQLRIVEK